MADAVSEDAREYATLRLTEAVPEVIEALELIADQLEEIVALIRATRGERTP